MKSMSIGRFIVFMGLLFLILVIALFSFLFTNVSQQYASSSFLMDYSGRWNRIFVALMEIGSTLDLVSLSGGEDDGMAQYEGATEALDEAIGSFLLAYDEDADTRNVLRRLQSFNEYQRETIENSSAPAAFYLDRHYVDTGIECHTEEILELYKSQMDMELERYSEAEARLSRMTAMSFTFIAVISIIISALYLWFGMTIRSAIGRAIENLEGISKGYWKVPNLQNGRFEEFRLLFVGINRLKHRLAVYFKEIQDKAEIERNLLDEKLKNETARRMLISSEMDMLRSQVNPHFLFNSLHQIGMAVLVNDPSQVLDMVECTGRILRYSLYNKEHLVSLSDELAIVETYIRLHKMSHTEDISFSILYTGDADEKSMAGRLIVPMCIQPVVENALKHGLGKDRKEISIKIFIGTNDGATEVTIKDDGVGIENPEEALKVNRKGIGLNNIRRRLELQYGRDDLIRVSSIVGKYTTVVLRFPEEGKYAGADR